MLEVKLVRIVNQVLLFLHAISYLVIFALAYIFEDVTLLLAAIPLWLALTLFSIATDPDIL